MNERCLAFFCRSLPIAATFVLTGCLWNPFDRDAYPGRAMAQIVIAGVVYRTEWDIEVRRDSSFNPYSPGTRQDLWRIEPNSTTVALSDGRRVWIDGDQSTPAPKAVLGFTDNFSTPRYQQLTIAPLDAEHPVTVDAPVFGVTPDGRHAAVCHECKGSIRYTVRVGYRGPSERNRLNGYDPVWDARQ